MLYLFLFDVPDHCILWRQANSIYMLASSSYKSLLGVLSDYYYYYFYLYHFCSIILNYHINAIHMSAKLQMAKDH